MKNHWKILDQNLSKINPKSTKNQWKIKQKLTQNQSKIEQKSTKNRPGAKNVAHFVLGAVLEASWRSLRGQHSSKLASQIEGKSIKNQCKNRSKIRCLPSSSFDPILIDFWRENGSMLAPKSNQKSMSTSKGRFCKKY